MIYFDLDGVLRDLCTATLGRQALRWNEKNRGGKGIIDIVNDNPRICETAPATEYLEVFNTFDFGREVPTILTRQLPLWIVHTRYWLMLNVIRNYNLKIVGPESKLLYLKKGDLLVEDYPGFDDFSQIALIDRPYNREADAEQRIYKPEELLRVLEQYKENR